MTIVDTDISDRKRLELALEASESKLNDILNSAIACIFSFRLYPNGTRKYEYYSKGSEVLYGYTAEEIMAARETDLWFSRVHPDDMQSIITPGWENIFTEKPYKCEFRFQHKDGSWRWISGALTSRRDDAADCWIVIGVDTDITDRKRAEEALEQSENQYRLLFENNPNPMWIYDPETLRFLAANYASVNYYGYSEAEFLSMTIADIRPPEDIPALQEVVTAIRPQSLSYSGEWRHCKKDGTIIDVEITSHVITSAGKQARFVLAKDVTARKQAEKSLRQSEEQLFQIIDNIEDVFFLKSIGTGELLHINRAYEKVFQRSCKSLYQNPNSWLEVIYPEDRDRIWAKVEGELNAETFFDDEYRIVCSDGSIRWLWDRSFPIYNEAGQIYRYAGVSRDITERKQLQLTLQSSEARLKDILNSAIASISSFRLYSDQTWDYEYRSEGCEAIFGYTAEEFMSDKELWRSRVVGQDLQNQVLPTFREIFAGRSGKTEYRFRHKDGSIRWIAETYRSQRDDNANCWVMVAVEIDITDRKILELSLQNSEAKLSDILNSAIATIFSFRFYPDRSRKFEYYSKGCEILFGYTAEELLADGANELWFSRVHPDDLQPILLREEEYFFAEQPVRSDYRFYHKNGSLRWISSMLTSRRDNAADCWIVTGVEIDITDRKRAEFALQQQLQQEQALSRVNQAIRNSLNLETIFSVAGKEIAQLISTDHASVVRYLPEQCCWIHVAEHRGSAQATAMGLSIPDENNPFAERLKQFEIVRVESTQDIDDPINRKMAETHPGAWLLVPLVVNQTLWGSMSLRKSEPFWQEEAVQ
jgi:PAS domain S-box-containing protein